MVVFYEESNFIQKTVNRPYCMHNDQLEKSTYLVEWSVYTAHWCTFYAHWNIENSKLGWTVVFLFHSFIDLTLVFILSVKCLYVSSEVLNTAVKRERERRKNNNLNFTTSSFKYLLIPLYTVYIEDSNQVQLMKRGGGYIQLPPSPRNHFHSLSKSYFQ